MYFSLYLTIVLILTYITINYYLNYFHPTTLWYFLGKDLDWHPDIKQIYTKRAVHDQRYNIFLEDKPNKIPKKRTSDGVR